MTNTVTKPKDESQVEPKATPRRRRTKPYPSIAFQDALKLGQGVMSHAGGQPIKRLTLMEKLDRSPTSGPTRSMVTDSSKYGITEGSFNAEEISLTKDGYTVCDVSATDKETLRASFRLALSTATPPPGRMPSSTAARRAEDLCRQGAGLWRSP